MCRSGNQYHVAVALSATLVIGADDHQTRILARCSRIGLQRAGGKARDCCQIAFQLLYHLRIAFALVGRGERVDILETCERKRLHKYRSIEFHRTRAERNHRVRQRDVAQLQTLDVAHQVALRTVAVEDGFGQYIRAAHERRSDCRLGSKADSLVLATLCFGEYADDFVYLVDCCYLVERDADARFGRVVEIYFALQSQRLYDGCFRLDF